MTNICPLCGRLLNPTSTEMHHLVPKCKKGKELVALHPMCHRTIHATFTENELRDYYHTIDRLLTHKTITKYAKWIAKKPVDFYDSTKETKGRKSKRRR